MASYEAIVFGGTGAVGSALVHELCASSAYTRIVLVGRRTADGFDGTRGAEKITQHVIDMAQIERDVEPAAKGTTVAFCTMGIGQPTKVSKEELWKVDVDHATAFARACKAAGVRHISLLTSVGANAKSRSYYMKVKGSVEAAYRELAFERTSFFRPSVLATKSIRYGFQDQVTQAGFPLISWMLPSVWHEVRIEDLARAMRVNAERPAGSDPVEVLHYADFMAACASVALA